MTIPDTISRDNILQAIKEVDDLGVPDERQSTKYVLIYEGKEYPPKYLVSTANRFANGRELDPGTFSGGVETNSFLEVLGFTIAEKREDFPNKFDQLIKTYLDSEYRKTSIPIREEKNKIYSKWMNPDAISGMSQEQLKENFREYYGRVS